MQHFFVEPSQIQGNEIRITGDDVNHIRNVLRMRIGEEMTVCNGVDDIDYHCGIREIKDDEIICDLFYKKESGVELPMRFVLYQAIPKADKMELVIQKAVELGAYRIVPVATERCVVKIEENKAASRLARWQLIAENAAKQSRRAFIPEVYPIQSFEDAVKMAKNSEFKVIPYEMAEGMKSLRNFVAKVQKRGEKIRQQAGKGKEMTGGNRVEVFIGPEGGFTEKEVEMAKEAGIEPVSLGRRILRTETAGMVLLSVLMYHLEQ